MNQYGGRLLLVPILVVLGCTPEVLGGGLVRVDEETAGENCAYGGHALHAGVDDDASGVLDDAEIESTTYLCDDAPIDIEDVGNVGNVAELRAIAGGGDRILLTWANPVGGSFAGVVIRRSAEGYPGTAGDGDLVFDGDSTSWTDSGLTIGTRYFYRAFAYDAEGQYGSGVDASATPIASGSLDPTFNESGLVIENGLWDAISTREYDSTLDHEGRLVAVGEQRRLSARPIEQAPNDGMIWRYRTDGTRDTSFAGEGAIMSIESSGHVGVTVDTANRVLVAGICSDAGATRVCITRYLTDGRVDASFGAGGKVVVPGSARIFSARLAVDASGNVLFMAGVNDAILLARFTEDGAVDDSFGAGGQVAIARLPSGTADYVAAGGLAVDGDSILVSGGGTGPSGTRDMALFRFDASGTPDPSLSGDGVAIVDVSPFGGTSETAYTVLVDPTGRIVVSGRASFAGGTLKSVIWRFAADGSLDASFGAGGSATLDTTPSFDSIDVCAIDTEGRPIAVGVRGSSSELVVLRFAADGSLDPSFGADGLVRYPLAPPGGSLLGARCALDAQGRIVVTTGATGFGGALNDRARLMLLRLLP